MLKFHLFVDTAGSEDDDWTPARLKRRQQAAQARSEADSEEEQEEEDVKPTKGLKRGRKSLKTPDTRDLFR
jgi:hypothetical protein